MGVPSLPSTLGRPTQSPVCAATPCSLHGILAQTHCHHPQAASCSSSSWLEDVLTHGPHLPLRHPHSHHPALGSLVLWSPVKRCSQHMPRAAPPLLDPTSLLPTLPCAHTHARTHRHTHRHMQNTAPCFTCTSQAPGGTATPLVVSLQEDSPGSHLVAASGPTKTPCSGRCFKHQAPQGPSRVPSWNLCDSQWRKQLSTAWASQQAEVKPPSATVAPTSAGRTWPGTVSLDTHQGHPSCCRAGGQEAAGQSMGRDCQGSRPEPQALVRVPNMPRVHTQTLPEPHTDVGST